MHFVFMDSSYKIISVPLDDISWKCKDDIELKNYECVDSEIPVMLVQTRENPHDLNYRAIDGSHRLCKLFANNKKTVNAYVIEEQLFFSFLVPYYDNIVA